MCIPAREKERERVLKKRLRANAFRIYRSFVRSFDRSALGFFPRVFIFHIANALENEWSITYCAARLGYFAHKQRTYARLGDTEIEIEKERPGEPYVKYLIRDYHSLSAVN